MADCLSDDLVSYALKCENQALGLRQKADQLLATGFPGDRLLRNRQHDAELMRTTAARLMEKAKVAREGFYLSDPSEPSELLDGALRGRACKAGRCRYVRQPKGKSRTPTPYQP